MAVIARTIREQVTNQIRDDLVAGNFPDGCVLREAELAKRFGVSRGPIRDAFLQLTQEGFLAYEANRGVRLREPPDPENREFIVSLRIQIETFVIRKGLDRLHGDVLLAVENALCELKVACEGDDVAAVARCDMAFHEAILAGCGGDDFILAWRQLCSCMLLTYTRLEDYEQVFSEHVELLEAVRAGKKQAIVAAIKSNIR
ncbi:MAG: GntR family transcriptional regulator [Planctomycetaceae bacterium]|nr:GntR family transcriptional regulator [Planctomycetaceae bacterium]